MPILKSSPLRHTAGPWVVLFFLVAALLALLAGCSSNDGGTRPKTAETLTADCVGCHTDRDMLEATAAPAPPTSTEGSGEG